MSWIALALACILSFGCGALNVANEIHEATTGGRDQWIRQSSFQKFEFPDFKITCEMIERVSGNGSNAIGDLSLICIDKALGKVILNRNDVYGDHLFMHKFRNDKIVLMGISNIKLYHKVFWTLELDGGWRGWLFAGSSKIDYCVESKQNAGVWYDEKNPNVEFIEEDGKLKDILINGCRGDRLSLKDLSSKWP